MIPKPQRQHTLRIAVSALTLALAAPTRAEPPLGLAAGDQPAEVAAHEKFDRSLRSASGQASGDGDSSPSALERHVQDVPRIEIGPEAADEKSKQPPASDTDGTIRHIDPTQGSSPPDSEKKEQSVAPGEKPDEASATAKTLKPIAPDETIGVLGKKVYGLSGEDMGMMIDVLVDAEGKPRAAVIDFGGFLGVGTRKIATDWQLLNFRPGDRSQPVLLTMSQAEVRDAPEYKTASQPAEIIAPPTPAEQPAPPDAEK